MNTKRVTSPHSETEAKKIASKYHGKCAECGAYIEAGDAVYWKAPHVWCEECGDDGLATLGM